MVLAPLVLPLLLAKPAPPPPPSRMEKLSRILLLEDTRSTGGGDIERYLRDPDRSVRRRAALAAGRLADRALVPTLVELMNDQEAEVRQMAAFALGLTGDPAAADRLVASLQDSEGIVRARAAEALGRLGEPRVAPDLARFVLEQAPKTPGVITIRGDDPGNPRDPWVELRLALFSLYRLKDAKAAATALLAGPEPRFDWWVAAFVAARLESPLLRPVLVSALSSTDPLARAFAARGLGALKDPSAVDLLSPLTGDRDASVAAASVKALGVMGDARGVPAVAGLLSARPTPPSCARPSAPSPSCPATAPCARASFPSWGRRSPGFAAPPSPPWLGPTATASPSSCRASIPTPIGPCAGPWRERWRTSATRWPWGFSTRS